MRIRLKKPRTLEDVPGGISSRKKQRHVLASHVAGALRTAKNSLPETTLDCPRARIGEPITRFQHEPQHIPGVVNSQLKAALDGGWLHVPGFTPRCLLL